MKIRKFDLLILQTFHGDRETTEQSMFTFIEMLYTILQTYHAVLSKYYTTEHIVECSKFKQVLKIKAKKD